MSWDQHSDRGRRRFWEDLGFEYSAAEKAAMCFPEYWICTCRREKITADNQKFRSYEELEELAEQAAVNSAIGSALGAPLAHRADAKHPAFWLAQGCDFDEAAARAIAAYAMVKLQQEATPPPPPPPRPDRFAEVTQALLLQGAMQQRLEGPDTYDDQYCDNSQSQGPARPQTEPFDPNDYPRFRTK